MADWKILPNGVTETTRLDERQKFVPIRVVRFMVGTHGPFQVTIDSADFTEGKVRELLDKEAKEVLGLTGGAP